MTPSEYLDAAKEKIGVASDYEFAKKMEIPNSYMPGMRQETRAIPTEVAFRIAMLLKLDPSEVIADLEAQRAKDERKREFFRGFLQKHNGIAARMSLFGIMVALGIHAEKLLQLASLSA